LILQRLFYIKYNNDVLLTVQHAYPK